MSKIQEDTKVNMVIPLPVKFPKLLLKKLIGPPIDEFQKIENIDTTKNRVDFKPYIEELLQLPTLTDNEQQQYFVLRSEKIPKKKSKKQKDVSPKLMQHLEQL